MRRIALTVLLLVSAPALAALARPVTVEALARESDAVVRGRVERRESRWSGDRLRIHTLVTVQVSAVWRGSAPGRVVVRTPGGEVGDVGQWVDAAPSFAGGEEVVVFLARHPSGDFEVHGLRQGKFRVEAGVARPGLEGVAFVPAQPAPGERRAEAMPLAELERRVRSVR